MSFCYDPLLFPFLYLNLIGWCFEIDRYGTRVGGMLFPEWRGIKATKDL